MANLLLMADLWENWTGAAPPECWGGTSYVQVNDYSHLAYQGAVGDADTLEFDLSCLAPLDFGEYVRVGANGGGLGDDIIPTATVTRYSIDLPAGATDVYLEISAGHGCGSDTVTVTPTAPPAVACAELGRVTRAYVSGYQRDRVHASRLVRGEKRCLVANFNGAIPAARSIASVTWRCEQNYTVVMANARISGREAEVDITAQLQGCAWVKCVATLDNGEAYTQMFRIGVCAAPWFDGEGSATTGPSVLTSP